MEEFGFYEDDFYEDCYSDPVYTDEYYLPTEDEWLGEGYDTGYDWGGSMGNVAATPQYQFDPVQSDPGYTDEYYFPYAEEYSDWGSMGDVSATPQYYPEPGYAEGYSDYAPMVSEVMGETGGGWVPPLGQEPGSVAGQQLGDAAGSAPLDQYQDVTRQWLDETWTFPSPTYSPFVHPYAGWGVGNGSFPLHADGSDSDRDGQDFDTPR